MIRQSFPDFVQNGGSFISQMKGTTEEIHVEDPKSIKLQLPLRTMDTPKRSPFGSAFPSAYVSKRMETVAC